MHSSVLLLSTMLALTSAESILMSKVFVIPIKPETFDWTANARMDRFSYQPSLMNAPDLPSWIHYVYSKKDHQGFLYGAAPRDQPDFQLEIVGLNKETYETKYKVLDMNVLEKENMTKYEVQLKIDFLDVEDMFDPNRTETLLDIFRKKLWPEAADLYVTFLAPATKLGARLPLNPGEAEGVVVRLGSSVAFSNELNKLQQEVKPLVKLSPCPRELKRTTVEIHFREAGFVVDWCSFMLLEDSHSDRHESARRGPSVNVVGLSSGIPESTGNTWQWARLSKSSIPRRIYLREVATTIFIPAILLLVLAALLSTVLCLQHDKVLDPESEQYFHELFNIFLTRREVVSEKREPSPVEGLGNNGVQMVHYAAYERGTLRSLSARQTSPNDSLQGSPKILGERSNPYVRPNPPPYTGPNNFISIRSDF